MLCTTGKYCGAVLISRCWANRLTLPQLAAYASCMKKHITKTFAENVFNYDKMRKYLPKKTFEAIKLAHEQNVMPSQKHIDIYAKALKKWALSRGVKRYTHWFQPLNGLTAEKRDSLFSRNKEGKAVVKFSKKQLLLGESDASSLPNGGMRETYEARGLTNWDFTAFAFIVGDCLRIPTTFCGASGQTLDKKTPLLKSNLALNKQALRVLSAIGTNCKYVKSVVGAEQEYFLIDKTLFDKRKDLVYTGRTLFGRMAPKGQEFEDHYFRPPDDKIIRFMREVDVELWKLGVIVKTEHNEVAPCQYELVPCYTDVNTACDQNQLVTETLNNVAIKRGFACLLHEKPFDKINGSGKHNNWSLVTDCDCNLLEAGNTPEQNARYLIMLSAIVKAVSEYGDLLVSSIASANNDLRLGGYEAPPRILTVFLGEPLLQAVDGIIKGTWRLGYDILPVNINEQDRNRTSPFAYTGNKFEFRMVGSSATIADVNAILNTVVAESFRQFADKLECSSDIWNTAKEIVTEAFESSKKIIYNGNGYSNEWTNEATARGLESKQTCDLFDILTQDKTVELFERHNILSRRELQALRDVKLKRYCDTVNLESVVSCEIYERQISPAVENYISVLTRLAIRKQGLKLTCEAEKEKIERISKLQKHCADTATKLKKLLVQGYGLSLCERANLYGNDVRETMCALRKYVNLLEQVCPKNKWPLPTYGQLLFDEK